MKKQLFAISTAAAFLFASAASPSPVSANPQESIIFNFVHCNLKTLDFTISSNSDPIRIILTDSKGEWPIDSRQLTGSQEYAEDYQTKIVYNDGGEVERTFQVCVYTGGSEQPPIATIDYVKSSRTPANEFHANVIKGDERLKFPETITASPVIY
jgi:hypothetical protein